MFSDNSEFTTSVPSGHAAGLENDCCDAGSCVNCEQPAPQSADSPPHEVDLSSSGQACGNPFEFALLQPGEHVLVLCNGAGRDVFSSAKLVARTGRIYGVEVSPQMLALAREQESAFRDESGLFNTDFREGRIADLPLFDNTVDVVLSNCVVNLAENREQTFQEAYRVLKPGGRLVLSDLVFDDDPRKTGLVKCDDTMAAWADALSCEDYLAVIQAAGFTDLQILNLQRYSAGLAMGNPGRPGIPQQLVMLAASLTLSALKPV